VKKSLSDLKKNSRSEYHREWKRKKREDLSFRLKAAEIQRRYYANDLNKNEKAFVYRLKTRYGLTKEQYNELFEKQKGCCALCGKHQSELKMRLAVDHCHQTSEIRSLLCSYCNLRVIGRLRKDTIQRIYDYLNREYTGWIVPPKKKKKKKNGRSVVLQRKRRSKL
jgi:DNA-directed RNA polymerase subunit RPC12/RpoP